MRTYDLVYTSSTKDWALIRDGKLIHSSQEPRTLAQAAKYFVAVVGVRADWQPHPKNANHYIGHT